ncbi:MAG: Crp/Fnr family transcriptional regulator, partial [Chloroflexota bacterium]
VILLDIGVNAFTIIYRQHNMASFLNQPLLDALRLFEFAYDSHIYIEETEQDYLYFLVDGQVQCSHYHANGKLAVIAFSEPFTTLGEMEIFADATLKTDVVALKKSVMLGILRTLVHQHGAQYPPFLHFIINEMRDKLYALDILQRDLVLPVTSRFITYLLTHRQGNSVTLPDKDSLAALLGTTVRHLNRVIKQLSQAKMVSDTYPRIKILDEDNLQHLYENS